MSIDLLLIHWLLQLDEIYPQVTPESSTNDVVNERTESLGMVDVECVSLYRGTRDMFREVFLGDNLSAGIIIIYLYNYVPLYPLYMYTVYLCTCTYRLSVMYMYV